MHRIFGGRNRQSRRCKLNFPATNFNKNLSQQCFDRPKLSTEPRMLTWPACRRECVATNTHHRFDDAAILQASLFRPYRDIFLVRAWVMDLRIENFQRQDQGRVGFIAKGFLVLGPPRCYVTFARAATPHTRAGHWCIRSREASEGT